MLAYILYDDLRAEKLVMDVNRLLEKFRKNNPDTTPILVIDIRTITKDDTTMIPKLEVKDTVLPND